MRIFISFALWAIGAFHVFGARPAHVGHALDNDNALALQDPTGCSGAMTSLAEACSRSVFVAMASSVASSMDCELLRTNNVVEIFASIFQRADAAELKGSSTTVPEFDDLKLCETSLSCPNCKGIRYTIYDNRTILMLPQPTSTGKSYAYPSDEPRNVKDVQELKINIPEIQKGLHYATLGSGIDDFEDSKKVLFTPYFHSRLQYYGSDPAIVTDLWSNSSSGTRFECNLQGPPPKNPMPKLTGTKSAEKGKPPVPRPVFWSPAAESRTTGDLTSQASATAYKLNADKLEPMGAVTMTVNMTYLGEALGGLPLSPSVYAMIADQQGRVMMMTAHGRKTIFHENMSEAQIRNPQNRPPCRADQTNDAGCWWEAPTPLTLLDAEKEEFSGINFKDMLQTVFNESYYNDHMCSSGVRTWTLDVPKCADCEGPHCGCQHLAVFCRLLAYPEWAIFVVTPLEELHGAATFVVDKDNITLDIDRKNQSIHKDKIVVHNTGRVKLPFTASISSAGKGDKMSGITIEPTRGSLEPGENQTLLLNFNLTAFGYGTSSGLVTVRPDLADDVGNCFRTLASTRFAFTRRKYPRTLLQVSGISVSVIATVVLIIVLYRVVSSFLRKYYDDMAKELSTIEKALQATQELSFPMVLLKVATFKKHGKFVAFEDILNESLWLHTIQDIDDFLTKDIKNKLGKKNKVIFMSHQWTAFSEPDHTGEQYKGMVEAVDTVIDQNGWDTEDTYVWLDYSSIPQRHRPSQTAAINSLTVYAAKVSAFVVVAPKVDHKDLEGVLCDEETYKNRAWCRAEQLSHLLAQAGDNMYLAKKKQVFRLNDDAAWLEQSIEVFKGELTCCRRKHVGMDMCDRERLVVPMLGLWAQLCRTIRSQGSDSDDASTDDKRPFADLKEIHKHLSERINEVFPETFTYEFENGSEERPLFGKLVQRLEERLDKEALQPKEEKTEKHWSKLRIATKMARLPATGGRRLSQALRSSTS